MAGFLSAILGVLLLGSGSAALETGNHPEWPRWCGKVYKPEYPSFDPGGQTPEPSKLPDGPALDVQFSPRYNIYLDSEETGEFIVRRDVSEWFGQPWPNLTSPADAPVVYFTINLVSNNDVLVSNNFTVGSDVDSYEFDLSNLEPSFDPWEVVLHGVSEDGDHEVTASSELFLLPEKSDDQGSVTKLDNLNGGMLFRNKATGGKFEPLLSYGFYASCDGFLCEDDSISQIQDYADLGLNGMVPLTTIGDSRGDFEFMDSLDLKFMYNLRPYLQNLSEVRSQVDEIKGFEALYAYWGADEPDGHQDPFNATVLQRAAIRKIDPYHPVAVTLNCQNYYFQEYTAGSDLIMEDVYPIGINSTFSKWGTACNTTYGDCGCDNCQGNVQDVSARLDDLAGYEAALGLWPPKTKLHNPQSFHGEGYWLREPTVAEEVAMGALAVNHGAKGSVSWVWPTSEDLARVHGAFAKVVTRKPVVDFVVLNKAERVDVEGFDVVDVAYWVMGDEVLVSVVNGGYEPVEEGIEISLSEDIALKSVKGAVWGEASWEVSGNVVKLGGLDAMSTNMAIISM